MAKKKTLKLNAPLSRTFYSQATLCVARELLGKQVVRELDGRRISGIIVEVEAYLATGDSASHSARGLTKRNAAMFMEPGTLYVYTIHARHCMNIVTEPTGAGAAVLIRGLEPWEGLEPMRELRNQHELRDLCTGPARLCQALGIDLQHNQIDLSQANAVWIEPEPAEVAQRPWQVTSSSRIGISTAQELPYRFFVDGHRCVSGLARLHQSPKLRWLWASR